MSGPETVASADAVTRARFDMVIDVRSPGEFAEDHVPGAVNLPVLDNAERAEVGTLYVQQSRFLARKVGGAYVARNIGGHLLGALADQPGGFRPLVYCWRGGMRSGAMAHILSQVGWRVGVLAGGYRTYRREVTTRLYDSPPGFRAVVLDGPTGSGKTEVLKRLPGLGVQVLDLEGLAEHRGSLLGALPLILGEGPGSELRRPLGVTIAGGLIVSQILTLYTTPVAYLLLEKLRLWRWRRPSSTAATAP